MNLRPISLVLVALLGAAGCVSVPAEAERPVPSASAHPANAPAAQSSTAPTAPPAVHDALGKTDDERERTSGKNKKRKNEEAERTPARADATAPPARQEAREQPRGAAPVRPEPPAGAGTPRRAQPQQTYDMRTVCARGQGVASPEIVDLCRTRYGR
uniref:Lipoprotein n=1 Tax=Streptomyces sp. NBC_01401 TaxID=2903854 RepID=A0AAU3H1Y9_9ACTN